MRARSARPQQLVEALAPVAVAESAPDEHVAPVRLGAARGAREPLVVTRGEDGDGRLDPLAVLLLRAREPERSEPRQRGVGRGAGEVATQLALEPRDPERALGRPRSAAAHAARRGGSSARQVEGCA
jgi:hypothetical protein